MEKDPKTNLDILSKLDKEMNQDDVINIMIAKFETNTNNQIQFLRSENERLKKERAELVEKIAKDFYDAQVQSVTITYPFDKKEYEYVLERTKGLPSIATYKSGKDYIRLHYKIAGENKKGYQETYSNSITEDLPDYSEVNRIEDEMAKNTNDIRICREEMININSRERQMKAVVSLNRLKDNEEFMQLLGTDEVRNLIDAPVNNEPNND